MHRLTGTSAAALSASVLALLWLAPLRGQESSPWPPERAPRARGGIRLVAEARHPSGPSVPPLGPGEAIHSESFDIERGGRLTYRRSLRREVGYLGAEVRQVEREASDRLRAAPFQGVLLVSVERGGPAARAGLSPDDIILSYGGEPVRGVDQFAYLVEETAFGAAVKVEVLRDGLRQEVVVGVESQPRISTSRVYTWNLPVVDDRRRTGMVLAELPDDLASLLRDLGAGRPGLMVAAILPGGPAFFSAARRKAVLVEAGGRAVRTAADYEEQLSRFAPGEEVPMVFLRDRARVHTGVQVARDATRDSEFDLPLKVFSYENKAERRKLRLLWGILYSSRTSHHIRESGQGEEHESERELAALLGLFRWHSEPRSKELRLFWLIPIRFKSS